MITTSSTGPSITPISQPVKPVVDNLDEINPNAIEDAIQRIINRTPEEIAATRERIFALSPPPRPLPPGKTLDDVVKGTWPGDETDEEVYRALEELS